MSDAQEKLHYMMVRGAELTVIVVYDEDWLNFLNRISKWVAATEALSMPGSS